MKTKPSPVIHLWRAASMLRRVWAWTLIVGIYSLLAVWKESQPNTQNIADFPSSVFTILGLTLGILLALRNV